MIEAHLRLTCIDMQSIATMGVRADTIQIDQLGIVTSAQSQRIEQLQDRSMLRVLMLKILNLLQHKGALSWD